MVSRGKTVHVYNGFKSHNCTCLIMVSKGINLLWFQGAQLYMFYNDFKGHNSSLIIVSRDTTLPV